MTKIDPYVTSNFDATMSHPMNMNRRSTTVIGLLFLLFGLIYFGLAAQLVYTTVYLINSPVITSSSSHLSYSLVELAIRLFSDLAVIIIGITLLVRSSLVFKALLAGVVLSCVSAIANFVVNYAMIESDVVAVNEWVWGNLMELLIGWVLAMAVYIGLFIYLKTEKTQQEFQSTQ